MLIFVVNNGYSWGRLNIMLLDYDFSLNVRYPKATYKIELTEDYINLNNLYNKRQFYIESIWDLIKCIENDLSFNRFPQNSVLYTSWDGVQKKKELVYNSPINYKKIDINKDTDSPKITFIIEILYHQNATWQGVVRWIEGKKIQHFRSLNELLKLIEDAKMLTQDEQKFLAMRKSI